MTGDDPKLNAHQQRHLLSSCQYVDRLLDEMEGLLAAAESESPFNRYVSDGSPAQRKVVHDFIVRLRREVVRALASEGLRPDAPSVAARHALRTHLSFIEVAIEELAPGYMRGYGPVPAEAAERLVGLVETLRGTVHKLDAILARGSAGDLAVRLERLETAGRNVRLVRLLQEIVDRHGLTEFRPSIDVLVARFEDRNFEVAVFGRVSTGKSSLLNHLLGIDVLPVGVNPITAIPTRLVHGPTLRVAIEFLTGRTEVLEASRLAEFVSEEENPANAKRVSRVTVQVPSPRLRDGIVFVDTPGVGSLATSGAAETLAYLPRCDVALVLVDAASTLSMEDLSTVQALLDSGAPVVLLLGKADLLSDEDLERVTRYVERQVREQIGVSIHPSPVSITPAWAAHLEDWFGREVTPLLEQHDAMRRRSLARKTGVLRETVAATLERALKRQADAPTDASADVEGRLRSASGEFERARVDGARLLDLIPLAWTVVRRRTAERLAVASHDAPVDAALRSAMDEVMSEMTQPLLERLEALITTARQALGEASAEGLDERRILRELPRPDLGHLTFRLKPGAIRLLGARATRNAIERAVDEHAGTGLQTAASAYGGLLRKWFFRALEEVRSEFEMAADASRAQVPGANSLDADRAGRQALIEDLHRLRDVDADDGSGGAPGALVEGARG